MWFVELKVGLRAALLSVWLRTVCKVKKLNSDKTPVISSYHRSVRECSSECIFLSYMQIRLVFFHLLFIPLMAQNRQTCIWLVTVSSTSIWQPKMCLFTHLDKIRKVCNHHRYTSTSLKSENHIEGFLRIYPHLLFSSNLFPECRSKMIYLTASTCYQY